MPRVLTVTPNPALDVSAVTDQVRPTSKLRCSEVVRTAGGGGINVARVLHALGQTCKAVFPVGGSNGALVQSLLSEQGVPSRSVPIAGLTRESFTVIDRSTSGEFRFVLPGPSVDASELQSLLNVVGDELQWPGAAEGQQPQWLVVSGSLPPGISHDVYGVLAAMAKDAEVRLVVDANADALGAALQHRVYFAKPSLGEMRMLTGEPLATLKDVMRAGEEMVDKGQVEVLIVSLGAQGAMLITKAGIQFAPPVNVTVRTAVGAGDSLVAGFVDAISTGRSVVDAFYFAVACASAHLSLAAGMVLDRSVVTDIYGRMHRHAELPTRMTLT